MRRDHQHHPAWEDRPRQRGGRGGGSMSQALLVLLVLLAAAGAIAAAAAAEAEEGSSSSSSSGGGGGSGPTAHAWPASYKVGNAHHGHAGLALRGESFTVYSRPMRTKYAEVYNARQAPIPLPPAIVERFRGKVIAITGYDIDVVQRLPDGAEVSVPSRDYYNHHYILGLRSADYNPPASMEEEEGDEEMAAEQRQHARAHDHRPPSEEVENEDEEARPRRHRFPLPSQGGKEVAADPTLLRGRRRRPPPAVGGNNSSSPPSASPEGPEGPEGAQELRLVSAAISERAETIPLIQVFCEANGGEFRQSLHGYPRGHAQLLKSPQSFWPFQLHFINTRASAGRVEPMASRAPPDAQYSGLIECPCTTRRVKAAQAHTIDGRPVSFDCRGEVLRQNNSVCALATYQGGYRCCEGGMVLLDAEQAQPEGTDEYHLKVRFWFEEYREEPVEAEAETGGLGVVRASHAHLFRLYLQTEQQAGEYDVPPCNLNTTRPEDCVHVLTSVNLAKELFFDCSFVDSKECADSKALAQAEGGFQIIYAAGHQHVGGLSLELYNMDTGELLCRQVPEYVGGYVEAIPPCVWSEAEGDGLPRPPVLTPETRLMSVARYDSSYKGHLGVMASWQARAMYRPTTTSTTSSAADPETPPPPYAHFHPPPRRRG